MESNNRRWKKENSGDKIWWDENNESVGTWEFTFDKKKVYNMFQDYPWAMTKEEVDIFDDENPYWAEFFADRKE